MTIDEITNIVYSILNWEEADELWDTLIAAGDEEDPIIVKYAEKLYLHPADLRNWCKGRIARATR